MMALDIKRWSESTALPQPQHIIRVALAVVAFLAYAVLALNLHQSAGERSYAIEREPMAAAVSHIVYGAPLGAEFAGLRNVFISSNSPIEDKLTAAAQGKVDRGDELLRHTLDGLGVGYPLFATAAMQVFGIHLNALIQGVLCLQGLAALVFLLRFRDERALIIPLYFFALSAMLATPIGTDPSAIGQAPIGGYRYFALLAVIPALYVALELIDKGDYPPLSRRVSLLVAQALLLTSAYIVNASVVYVTAPIISLAALVAISRRHERENLVLITRKFGYVMGVALVAYGMFYIVALKAYRQSGHVGDLFWHRIFISYGANPAWPFGNLNEVYAACKRDIPRGLVPGIVDQNGHCVWDAYGIGKGYSSGEVNDRLYGAQYEKVLRSAFFKVFLAYPRQSIKTFLYYKPIMLIDTLRILLRLSPKIALLPETVLVVQGLFLASFAIFGLASARQMGVMAGTIGLMGLSTFGLYFAAWSNPWTSSDLVCYLFMLIGLAAVTTILALATAREELLSHIRQHSRAAVEEIRDYD